MINGLRVRIAATFAVPDFQPFAPLDGVWSGDGQSNQERADLARRIGSQLSSGGSHILPQHDELPLPAKRSTQVGFFRAVQPFVEPACRLKRRTGAEEETSARQS